MTGGTRDGGGRYDRDPEVAKRDGEAAALRARGLTYEQIADELGMSKSNAHRAVKRALRDTMQEPADDVRRLELDRLDRMHREVLAVLERRHVTVQQGKVVYLDDEPLLDDAPVLNAVDRLLRIQERRARLLGLDAPVRVSVDAEALGREIEQLLAVGMASDDDDEPDADAGDA